MKRILVMMVLCLGATVCLAQKTTGKKQVRQQPRQLFYCSCAYTNYGLPAGEISHSYYELIADKGKKPRVVYCEERGWESEKKDYPATEKDVAALYATLQELNVDSLDGYRVSEDMMGGTSYRIHVEYADGRQVTANWFTHSPKGEAVSAYHAILRHLSAIASHPRK